MTVGGKFLDLGGISVDPRDGSRRALVQVDRAIEKVANVRGEVGALINRLETTIDFTTDIPTMNTMCTLPSVVGSGGPTWDGYSR